MKKTLMFLGVLAAATLTGGCARTVYVTDEPPAPREEVKPPAPGPRAAWVDGNWKWSHGHYVWAPGHWERNAKGTWVAGHWDKRPHGHVWVPGHWRK